MLKKLQSLGKQITELHRQLSYDLAKVKQDVQRTKNSQDHANTAYFMREMSTHLEEIAKQCRKVQETAEFVGTMVIETFGGDPKVQTPYVTATVQHKTQISIPHHKRDPEEFQALMQFLEIEPVYWNCEEPVVNLRWDGVQDRVNKLLAEGKPLPQGLDLSRQSSLSKFRLTKRREISEDNAERRKEEGDFLF